MFTSYLLDQTVNLTRM